VGSQAALDVERDQQGFLLRGQGDSRFLRPS